MVRLGCAVQKTLRRPCGTTSAIMRTADSSLTIFGSLTCAVDIRLCMHHRPGRHWTRAVSWGAPIPRYHATGVPPQLCRCDGTKDQKEAFFESACRCLRGQISKALDRCAAVSKVIYSFVVAMHHHRSLSSDKISKAQSFDRALSSGV